MNSFLPAANNHGAPDDHLHEACVFSVYGLNGENVYRIAKVVKIRGDAIHLFVYDKSFSQRPSATALDGIAESSGELTAQDSRDMYYPVSRKLFSLMRPIFLGEETVIDFELNGYRQWCMTGAGHVFGTDIRLDDEIEQNVRVYAKIFMTCFAPTFIAFTFYMLAYGAIVYIPFAFLFGAIFGGIMVILQWASVNRQRKDGLSRVSASTIQFHELEMPVDFATAFESGVRSLACIENCKPIAVDLRGGTIEAKVRKSLVEEGQEILIVFSRIDLGRTACIVWSESSRKGTTVDMGKNLGNVNAIISYLKSSTQSKQAFLPDVVDNMATESDREKA